MMVKTSTLLIVLIVFIDMVTIHHTVGITTPTIMIPIITTIGIHRAGALALAGDGVTLTTATGGVPGTGAEAIGAEAIGVVTGAVATGIPHTTRTGQHIHTIIIVTTSAMDTDAPITVLSVAADIAAAIL